MTLPATAPPATTVRPTLPTTVAPATALPAVSLGPTGRGALIDDIEIGDGVYLVSFRTDGFFPKIDETDPASHHVHFFFDTRRARERRDERLASG